MNPVGQLPAANSPSFSLNAIDWQKLLRFLLVQLAGLFVTYGAPYLLGFRYVIHGQDCTAVVLALVAWLLEVARRFVAGQQPPPLRSQPLPLQIIPQIARLDHAA